ALYWGAAKSAGRPAGGAAPGAGAVALSTIGAAAIAEDRGGFGAGAGAPATAGARWAAGAGAPAGVAPAARSIGAPLAVRRPLSGTMRTFTRPRSAAYSNSVSAIWSMWSADSDGATSTSSA